MEGAAMPYKDLEKKKARDRRYNQSTKAREAQKRYRESAEGKAKRKAYLKSPKAREATKNREHSLERKLAYQRYYNTSKGKNTARRHNERQRQKRREAVFNHYGKICARCGESDRRVLSIDHIEGGGRKHQEEVGVGSSFYVWLIKNNFPEGFQTLCMKCQFIKRHENNECKKHTPWSEREAMKHPERTIAEEQYPLFNDLEE